MKRIGIVVIGRNEGERLRRCLESVQPLADAVVYVDSGSSDGSVELARGLGAKVVLLDMERPFTAGRARNEGFRALIDSGPSPQFVQFVDGDCEVREGWLAAGEAFLQAHLQVAALCGRNRERFPERSVYNRICDIEWNTPVGEARACGGNVMMRVAAFEQVGGFRDDLIAGEEPELCVRLRALGWRVWRLDAEMTLHDAAMTRFGQWWKRRIRTGFAYAEGVRLHGAAPERHYVREYRSAWFWGAGIPLAVVLLAIATGPAALLALSIYPAQVARLALRSGGEREALWQNAFFLVAGKFPEALGQARSWLTHARGRRAALIEYK
jgi:glycosyltransferase involved in cell wall biosynthesis